MKKNQEITSVDARVDQLVKDYNSQTLPDLITLFTRSIEDQPEQREEAERLLQDLTQFFDAHNEKRKTASLGAQCLAAAVFMQNMCARVAIVVAEDDKEYEEVIAREYVRHRYEIDRPSKFGHQYLKAILAKVSKELELDERYPNNPKAQHQLIINTMIHLEGGTPTEPIIHPPTEDRP
jgi:hypothetical protein